MTLVKSFKVVSLNTNQQKKRVFIKNIKYYKISIQTQNQTYFISLKVSKYSYKKLHIKNLSKYQENLNNYHLKQYRK